MEILFDLSDVTLKGTSDSVKKMDEIVSRF